METERPALAKFLHDLRTPLNQIIGLSEMLMEMAEEEQHLLFREDFRSLRHAGIGLMNLLQDERLISLQEGGARAYPLEMALRVPLSRIVGYTELFLNDAEAETWDVFYPDVVKIQGAARRMVDYVKDCGVFIQLGTEWVGEPIVEEEEEEEVLQAGKRPLIHGRVLVVDDESLNREVLCRRLLREGCEAVGAASGTEALDRVHEEPFDAVLLDIQMPGLSGLEVLQIIKEDVLLRHLPVIMLSAHSDAERIARCLELGAEDFLPKPIDNTVLRARLNASLAKKRMAEELLHASRLQSIGFLAGGLAHDYNNMLAAVLGNLSILRYKGGLPTDLLGLVSEAERGAQRAQELTRYLLTFADGGAPVKQPLHLAAVVEDTCATLLRGTPAKLELVLPEQDLKLEADPEQVRQAVRNVVENALEASPAEGRITVRLGCIRTPVTGLKLAEGEYAVVEVEDRGCGISREDRPHVFDPFFTTKAQARGLGLATAYSIVQRHGGDITLRSMPGAGTTVWIYLPAHIVAAPAVAPAVEPTTPVVKESTNAPRPERVLVMDDEEPIRMLSETMLALLGYEVVATEDGEKALAAHAQALEEGRPFDFAVFDLNIPGGMGGAEAMRRLRERDAKIRTIVASGYSNDPVMSNHTAHGFNAVLPKPYVMADLMRTLEGLKPASK